MLVTINTDASFHPTLKHAGYAFWIKSDKFKITRSGIFKSKCINSHDAEARCIINALNIVLKYDNVTKIIVNTDSLNAIALITNDKLHIKRYIGNNFKMWKHIRKAFHDISFKKKFEIEYRHVKAHSEITDKRTYVNNWCDEEAKKQMRSKI